MQSIGKGGIPMGDTGKNSRGHGGENPDMEKSAIALEYETGDVAPKVIASGKGYLAEKIISAAGEHDIPVHKDAKLAKNLAEL